MLARTAIALGAALVARHAQAQHSSIPGPSTNRLATPAQQSFPFDVFSIDVPSFNQDELILLYTPTSQAGPQPAPLLVVNHGFGVSALDSENTGFPEEASARGWYVLSLSAINPFGVGVGFAQNNYGSVESQTFAEAGLEFTLQNFPIDRDRLYGVGFSMGSAQCLSYAARHQDPDGGMYAALVNNAGSVDQSDTWLSQPNARPSLENTLVGDPAVHPFGYRRSSLIQLDPVSGRLLNTETAFAHNLVHTPTQVWLATQDPWAYIQTQTLAYVDFLAGQPAALFDFEHVVSNDHAWDTIDYGACLDFLEPHRLVVPSARRVIADRDGRWLYFDVSGIPPETFATFDYLIDLENDIIAISDGMAFTRIETDLTRWNDGSTHSLPLGVTLEFASSDTEVVLSGVSETPVAVTRDGASQASGWTYDAATQTLTITEPDTGPHAWEFIP